MGENRTTRNGTGPGAAAGRNELPDGSGCGGILLNGITMNARTLMFAELSDLFRSVGDAEAPTGAYGESVLAENCTGRETLSARKKTWMYLKRLYRCDPGDAVFRAFRSLWGRVPEEGRPLLAFQMAWTGDPLLRKSAEFFLNLPIGAEVTSQGTAAWAGKTWSFSSGAAASLARNLNSTWQQAGYLEGDTVRRRTRAEVWPGNVVFALWLGTAWGRSGSLLFSTPMAELLDRPVAALVGLAETAAQKGWLGFKHLGDVMELSFSGLPGTGNPP